MGSNTSKSCKTDPQALAELEFDYIIVGSGVGTLETLLNLLTHGVPLRPSWLCSR